MFNVVLFLFQKQEKHKDRSVFLMQCECPNTDYILCVACMLCADDVGVQFAIGLLLTSKTRKLKNIKCVPVLEL